MQKFCYGIKYMNHSIRSLSFLLDCNPSRLVCLKASKRCTTEVDDQVFQ